LQGLVELLKESLDAFFAFVLLFTKGFFAQSNRQVVKEKALGRAGSLEGFAQLEYLFW